MRLDRARLVSSSYWRPSDLAEAPTPESWLSTLGDRFTARSWLPQSAVARLVARTAWFIALHFSLPLRYWPILYGREMHYLRGVHRRQGRLTTHSSAYQVIALRRLAHLADLRGRTVCVIGDGFSEMSLLLAQPHLGVARVYSVNLLSVLPIEIVALLESGFDQDKVTLGGAWKGESAGDGPISPSAHSATKVSFIAAEDDEALDGITANVFVSLSAIQEMTETMIDRYLTLMRQRDATFYCIMREEKRLPGGSWVIARSLPWAPLASLEIGVCEWMGQTLNPSRPWWRCHHPHLEILAVFDGARASACVDAG